MNSGQTEKCIEEAKEARAVLQKSQCVVVGQLPQTSKGQYLINYANCLLNRQIDIFDDAMLLIDSGRIPSACTISRGMIETYAFAFFLGDKVEKILDSKDGIEGAESALKVVLKFTNSSRFKVTEQNKLSKKIIDINDYHLTEQAITRMLNMVGCSQHVMDALRFIFEFEMKSNNRKESQIEILYDVLSEWVHPSQTSVFHNYVPESHLIPTSVGIVHLHDSAKFSCAKALHFITDSKNIYDYLLRLADEINKR